MAEYHEERGRVTHMKLNSSCRERLFCIMSRYDHHPFFHFTQKQPNNFSIESRLEDQYWSLQLRF